MSEIETRGGKIPSVTTLLLVVVVAMMPLYGAFAEMQATPITDPPTEGAIPSTPVPSPTEPSTEPEPAQEIPASTPEAETPRLVQPQAVDADGSLSCPEQPSDQIVRGGTIAISCTFSFTVGLGLATTAQIERPEITGGYTASIEMSRPGGSSSFLDHGSGESDLNLLLGVLNVGSTISLAVEIEIAAPAMIPAGSQFDETFNACVVTILINCGNDGSVTITAEVVPFTVIENEHYSIECNSNESLLVGFDENSIWECSLVASEALGNYVLQTNEILTSFSQGEAGWVLNVSGLPDPLPALSAGESLLFELNLTPTACSAGDLQPEITVHVNLTPVLEGIDVGDPASSEDGASLYAEFDPPVPYASASVSTEVESVNGAYDMTSESSLESSITIQYIIDGCDPWDGYAEMTPFTQTNGIDTGRVPRLESASHGSTVEVGEGDTTITYLPISELDESQSHLLTGTAPGQQVNVDHTINLVYTIPANTPVGEYESTITVSTVAAP